jgi:hypothetical protein
MFKDVDLKHYPLWLVGGLVVAATVVVVFVVVGKRNICLIICYICVYIFVVCVLL